MLSPLQFSHSFLDCFYEVCPEMARRQYVTKDKKKVFQARADGIDKHRLLERRVKHNEPFPAELASAEKYIQSISRVGPLEVEVPLGIDVYFKPISFWSGWFRGKFDMVARNYEKKIALLADWKTGKVREKLDQIERGALLLLANDPNIDEVIGFNIWLKADKTGPVYRFTRGGPAPAKLVQQCRGIEAMDPAKEWPKRPSGLCGYCPVDTCDHNPEKRR